MCRNILPYYTHLSTVSIPYTYRYGFCAKQGEERAVSFAIPRYSGKRQERETSLNQSITSAEYWFYDGRLGRRWNVDPVVKEWRSRYDAFNNNPLIFIDPNGDDDYFKADGTYSHSTSTGTQIKILTDKYGYLIISKLNPRSEINRKRLAKVMSYYAGKVGITGTVGVKMNSKEEKTSIINPMFYDPSNKGIYLNSRGNNFNGYLDNINNFKNMLFHEKLHKSGNYSDDYTGHAKVYIDQTSDASFENTTLPYKQSIVYKTAEFILSAKSKEEANSTDLIIKFNSGNKGGYRMEYDEDYEMDENYKIIKTTKLIEIYDKENKLVCKVPYNEKLGK